MDLLTFTLMTLTSVNHYVATPNLSVGEWEWQTWATMDRGIWVDVRPLWMRGQKFTLEGETWKW